MSLADSYFKSGPGKGADVEEEEEGSDVEAEENLDEESGLSAAKAFQAAKTPEAIWSAFCGMADAHRRLREEEE